MRKKTQKRTPALAEHRAARLLKRHLTPLQLYCWELNHFFLSWGKTTGSVYMIIRRAGSVDVVDVKNNQDFCVLLFGEGVGVETVARMPLSDQALALKLLVETSENRFLKTAKRRWRFGV